MLASSPRAEAYAHHGRLVVVHVVQYLGWGGVGSIVYDLAGEMVRQGHEVHIVALSRCPDHVTEQMALRVNEEAGVRVQILSGDARVSARVFGMLRRAVTELASGREVVLDMHLKWGVLAGVLGTFGLRGVTRVETYHSHYRNYLVQSLVLRPFIHGFVGVSQESVDELHRKFLVPKKRSRLIHNGVRVSSIQQETREVLPDNTGIRFLSAGRFSTEKGFAISIAAFAGLIESRSDVVYGLAGSGPQEKYYRSLLSDPRLLFLGSLPREEVYREIARSHVVVMPSLWEGTSLLMLEALSVGRAMLVSDIASTREVFHLDPLGNEPYRVFECGVQVHPGDSESIRAGMEFLCANRRMLEDMGRKSRSLAESRISPG